MTGGSAALARIRTAAERAATGEPVEFRIVSGPLRDAAIVWNAPLTDALVIRGSPEEMAAVLPGVLALYRGMLPAGGVQ